jgi:hypothetical protein
MTKYILLTFLFFILTYFCQALHLDKNRWHDFEGKLGTKDIRLSIYLLDNGLLKGSYCYTKYETKIQLTGQISDNKIELTELINGNPTGYFIGKIFTDSLDKFEGIWTDSFRIKNIDFKTTYASASAVTFLEERYNDIYGTDVDVEKFMKKIKVSILGGDKEWIASHINFPLKTSISNNLVIIRNKKQLIDNFEKIFHPEFKNEIKSSCVCNMSSNYQGVMLGHGQIWINNKPNSTQDNFDFIITAINN